MFDTHRFRFAVRMGSGGAAVAWLATAVLGCAGEPTPVDTKADATIADTALAAADANCPVPDVAAVTPDVPVVPPDVATADVPVIKPEEKLQPGAFQSPWVRLKRLQDQVSHAHIDEVRYRAADKRVFQCSYTFGVMDATNAAGLKYLAQNIKHAIPNDKRTPGCIHLAPDGDIIWTTHRGNLSNPTFISGWDIAKKDAAGKNMQPLQLPVLQEPGESYEGIDAANGYVYVALRLNGMAIYQRDAASNVLARVGSVSGLGSTWGLRVVGNTAYVSDIGGGLATVDVTDPKAPKLLGKVTVSGVAKGLTVEGKYVYLAAGDAGLVIIDTGDLTKPKVVGQIKTRGTAVRTAYSEGRVVVAAWNDTRAYDVTDPAAPKFIGAVRLTTDLTYPDDGHPPATARTMGVAMNGKDVFIGNWWVPYAYRLYPERLAPNIVVPEDSNMVDFGPVAAGKTGKTTMKITNQGTAPLTLVSNWTSATNFTVSPPQMRLDPGQSGTLDLAFTATATATKEFAVLNILSDDPEQPVRQAFLVANQEGFGVGKPFPETKATLLDGSDWSSSSVKGKVMLLGYFATFCPVCSIEVKDFEDRFQKKYGDKIEIVKLDANGDPLDGVQQYVKNLGITYKIGLEHPTTKTLSAIQVNFKGVNPFPDDVVVGKDGIVRYVSREYDPDGITAAIEAALAQ